MDLQQVISQLVYQNGRGSGGSETAACVNKEASENSTVLGLSGGGLPQGEKEEGVRSTV